jgi:ribosomal protein S19E (S16A)
MIDIHKNFRRLVSNEGQLLFDKMETEIAEEFEVKQYGVLEA